MRILAATVAILTLSASAAVADVPNARAQFVERRGLLEVDAQCHVFGPGMRSALEATALQARGALLRDGWSYAQMNELERAAVQAARARRCGDPRTTAAVQDAQHGYAIWARANQMEFPGWRLSWVARRVAGQDGWRLLQNVTAPLPASFGVRETRGVQQITLLLPVANERAGAASAQLVVRDAPRARVGDLDLTGRMARGLEAGLPAPGASVSYAGVRRVEHPSFGRTQIVFIFPDAAFRTLMALDPRETVEIRLDSRGLRQRILIEVGDLAAARGFVASRAD
ncbi:hypothetical protein [Terricaulis sp.]|uniref:hypothetical protein n=1 Tax=Terricaulis sp. TaxID=2768686 RepID=UPI0037842532